MVQKHCVLQKRRLRKTRGISKEDKQNNSWTKPFWIGEKQIPDES